MAHDLVDNEHQGREKTERLEGISPNQRFDAPLARVEPDQSDHDHYRERKRDGIGIENKSLQDDTDHIETDGSTRHLGKKEKGGTRLVGPSTQPIAQISIDGSEMQTIIDREEDKGNGKITQDEAKAHLQIGHARLERHTWDRDKGNARNRSPDHTEGYHIPRRTAIRTKESLIVRLTCREPAKQQKDKEIDNDNKDYQHKFLITKIHRSTKRSALL